MMSVVSLIQIRELGCQTDRWRLRQEPDFTRYEIALIHRTLIKLISRKTASLPIPTITAPSLTTDYTDELNSSSWTGHRLAIGSRKYPLSKDPLGRYNLQ